MSSRSSGGRQVVGLENILVLRFTLVEIIVLSPDTGHLEHVAQNVSGCKTEDKVCVLGSDGGNAY